MSNVKFKPCYLYAQGRCKFGNGCKFSHDVEHQVSITSSNTQAGTRANPTRWRNQPLVASGSTAGDEGGVQESSDNVNMLSTHPSATKSDSTKPPNANPRLKRGEIPCKAWKSGSCTKGARCWFGHDPEAKVPQHHVVGHFIKREERGSARQAEQRRRLRYEKGGEAEAERTRQVEANRRREERRKIEEERERARQAEEERRCEKERVEREEQERALQAEEDRRREEARVQEEERKRARQVEHQARMAEIAKQEAAKTIQHVVLGSLVTFAAGLEIQSLVAGFDSCTVQIKNLPADAREEEIAAIFLDQGIEAGHFQILENKLTADGKRTAKILTSAENGQAISAGLDDIEFRDEKLVFEVGTYNLSGGMGVSTLRDTEVLTISWRGPSVRYVVEFPDAESTRRQIQALNGKLFMDRRVKVQLNTPPPGRFLSSFNPNSIVINNLPPSVSDEDVRAFAGPCWSVKRLRQGIMPQSNTFVMNSLRRHIDRISHGLTSFEEGNDPNKKLDCIVVVKARFDSWDEAHRIHQSLVDNNFPRTVNIKESAFWLRLPNPMQYTLTISAAQFAAQKDQWESLVESIKDKKACDLVIAEQRDVVRMRLSGQVKEAVGALKVRVESLTAGVKVEGWHSSMGYSKNSFLLSIPEETGGFLRADYRRKVLKAYGKPEAVEAIRKLVVNELQKLASREWSTILQRQSVGFFIRQGVPALKEMFGDESVQLNAATRVITIRGGEEAQHMLRSLIDQSLTESKIPLASINSTDEICPVCYDSVSNPLVLGCNHVYCTPCMRHFLTSAEESDKFPLVCMGDESRCGVPIPIPVIQRFLPPAEFNRLLEITFTSHVTKHPQELKCCKTPDCTQIYRSSDQRSIIHPAIQCPSCFSTICSSCHDDAHEGMTCDDFRFSKDQGHLSELSEQWIQQMKKCPDCQAPIEKSGGCNHMTCRCGAHICWRCMGVFHANTIYEHMNTAHGGIDEEELGPNEDELNYHEQEELLQQAAEVRRRQEEERVLRLLRAREAEDRYRRWQEQMQQDRHLREAREAEARRLRELRQEELRRIREREEQQRAQRATEQQHRWTDWAQQQRREATERERRRSEEQGQGWSCTIM